MVSGIFGLVTEKYYSKIRITLLANPLFIMIDFCGKRPPKTVLWKENQFFPLSLCLLWVLLKFLSIPLFMKVKIMFSLFFYLSSCLFYVRVVFIIEFFLINFIGIMPLSITILS